MISIGSFHMMSVTKGGGGGGGKTIKLWRREKEKN